VVDKAGQADATFVQHVGAPLPEYAGIYEQMMYLRVAMLDNGGTRADN
jgi:hypothetical protein